MSKKPLADEAILTIVSASFPQLDFEKVTEIKTDTEIFTIDQLKNGRYRLIYSQKFIQSYKEKQSV